ncbi:MAG TPA: TlpA disulfide reductase family protein [Fimbriimonadaceae bacterium]|nr:TlpA disulfide reductase family protein [Fimbriimonadaceae bacterium]
MLRIHLAVVLVAIASFLSFGFVQKTNPAEVLKAINEYRASTIAKARESGTQLDLAAMNAEVLSRAKTAVEGVKIESIDAAEGYAWAQLFQLAEMPKMACDAAAKYLTTNPSSTQRYSAQFLMINSCNSLGEAHMVAELLTQMTPPNASAAASLASSTAYMFADTIHEKLGIAAALKALDDVEKLIPFATMTSENDQRLADSARVGLTNSRAELLLAAGKKQEALASIDKTLALMKPENASVRTLTGLKTRIALVGSAAPALTFEKGYGEFAGLESLKGKVVLIDFFAHWCGPCIRSFPDMKKLYEDLKPKGLEIVGFTTYYGYYKGENAQKRDMPKDVEYAKMAEFIKENGLSWPVVYGDRTNVDAHGVTGIPHVTVVDRKGNVHKIKVGYSPDSFGAFRSEIEKLLAEGP